MHSYQHNIKTFNNATRFLTRVERSLYRDLIELYYDTEQPLQSVDFGRLCRQVMAHSDEEKEALKYVLSEFFVLTGDVYTHNYCDEQIEKFRTGISAKAKAGVASAEAKKQKAAQRINERVNKKEQANNEPTTEVNTRSTAVTNQEPLTTNHKNLLSSTDDVVVDELSKSSQPAKPRLACPVEKLIDVYHTAFPDGSRVKVITAARRAAAKARWLEASHLNVQPFRYANEAEGLAAWRKFFEVCAESDFLTGKVAPQAGRQTWVADFDFFMQPSSFAKCLENKYHREIAA